MKETMIWKIVITVYTIIVIAAYLHKPLPELMFTICVLILCLIWMFPEFYVIIRREK